MRGLDVLNQLLKEAELSVRQPLDYIQDTGQSAPFKMAPLPYD